MRPNTPVTLSSVVTSPSGAGVAFTWSQVSGTTVPLVANGPTATFTAPSKTGTLQFKVTVSDGSVNTVSDTVAVNVSTTQTIASTTSVASGGFSATPAFATSGQALVVYGGGTTIQLEAAARSAGASGVWVQDAFGSYQLLIIGGSSFLRDAFVARFPAGFASLTAMTLVR